ncbi:MAG: hypothetical protein ACOX2U_08570 [Limisphaerales bacterium]|nr:hypothetical protein [Verrucomicrobiota bacterium]
MDGITGWLLSKWLFTTLPALILIMGLGHVAGEFKLPGNFKLGVAAVFFVGVVFGIFKPDLEISHDIERFGLALFIYCVGLVAAPAFFQSFRRNGVRLNLATFCAITAIFLSGIVIVTAFNKKSTVISGLFCGTLTNTPALSAAKEAKRLVADSKVNEAIEKNGWNATEAEEHRVEQARALDENLKSVDAGYGVAYPFAIVGILLIMQFHLRREKKLIGEGPKGSAYQISVVELLNEVPGNYRYWTGALINKYANVVAPRYRLDGKHHLIDGDTQIPMGAMVVIEGPSNNVEMAVGILGKSGDQSLLQDREHFLTRFFSVSDRHLINRSVWTLKLSELGASICRIRRGDGLIEINSRTRLQLGDQVRAIVLKDAQISVNKYFGNSLHMATEHTFFSLFLGLALGLLIGQIPIPIPGVEVPVTLGYAGGPLVVALTFGALGRTGPFVWVIAPAANMALRHVGFALFLAVIGVNSGSRLLATLKGDGLFLILASLVMLVLVHLILWLVLLLFRVPNIPTLLGVMSGLQTQPAALGFASARTDATGVNVGYASVYPLATILKIFYAQLLILLFL